MSEQWGIVQLMGHKRLAGIITEEEKFSCKLGRVDVPEGDKFTTHFFGGSSIYQITFTSEQVARDAAKGCDSAPVHAWDYPGRINAAKLTAHADEDEGDIPFGNGDDVIQEI